jgi:hypothetical protein
MAANFADLIKKHTEASINFDKVVRQKEVNDESILPFMERHFGSHVPSIDSFLVKLIEKTKGETEVKKFLDCNPNGIKELSGFQVEITNFDREDKPEIRKFITTSDWAFCYCRDVKDRPEIRKLITDPYWAYIYCKWIKDRPEIRKYIIENEFAYSYCRDIKDRPKMRKLITNSYWAYLYCKNIKDRPEMRKLITNSCLSY